MERGRHDPENPAHVIYIPNYFTVPFVDLVSPTGME
jgi:hypothetical protein